jgi:zinc transporter ZupT
MMHNFTDGVAMGACYAGGKGLALAATLSIFAHEVPHEIGDFTILIQGGVRLVCKCACKMFLICTQPVYDFLLPLPICLHCV